MILTYALSHSADTIPPFNRCCLSCEFNCGYVDVSFSHNMHYFVLYCKGERLWPWTSRVQALIFNLFYNSGLRACNWISSPCQVESLYRTGREQITSNRCWMPLISHRNKCLVWLHAGSHLSTAELIDCVVSFSIWMKHRARCLALCLSIVCPPQKPICLKGLTPERESASGFLH